MINTNCNTTQAVAAPCPADWSLTELHKRAGALARETLKGKSPRLFGIHYEDMTQTAVIAFLEHAHKDVSYAYGAARIALKNYDWIHIRGLNGGWKSLACIEHGYTLLDSARHF